MFNVTISKKSLVRQIMKKFLWMVVLLLAMSQIVLANGNAKTIESSRKSLPLVTVTLTPGSLLENIEQIARENGWTRVVWKNKKDYSWTSQTQITGESFADIMGKIMKNYPLQAVFYQGNHVLVIQPRTI